MGLELGGTIGPSQLPLRSSPLRTHAGLFACRLTLPLSCEAGPVSSHFTDGRTEPWAHDASVSLGRGSDQAPGPRILNMGLPGLVLS